MLCVICEGVRLYDHYVIELADFYQDMSHKDLMVLFHNLISRLYHNISSSHIYFFLCLCDNNWCWFLGELPGVTFLQLINETLV